MEHSRSQTPFTVMSVDSSAQMSLTTSSSFFSALLLSCAWMAKLRCRPVCKKNVVRGVVRGAAREAKRGYYERKRDVQQDREMCSVSVRNSEVERCWRGAGEAQGEVRRMKQ